MIKKIVHFPLLVICIFSFLALSPSIVEAFSGSGSGTSGDPYQITTCAQLLEMGNSLSSYYQQDNDIDCTGVSFTTIAGTFTGTFNGLNYAISNITILAGGGFSGLFNVTNGATIKNVRLTSGSVAASASSTGSFAGRATNTLISHCSSNLSMSAASDIGGFIGRVTGSTVTIEKSYFTGNLSGSSFNFIGGFVGYMDADLDATIIDSYSSGTYTTNWIVGGLVGYVGDSPGHTGTVLFTNSYSSATLVVSGVNDAGGLIGYFSKGTTSNSFGAATITGTGTIGGAFGYGAGTSTGNYYDTYLAGVGSCSGALSASCTAVNSSNATPNYFKNNSTNAPLSGWNFTTIWQTTAGYPTLRGFTSPAPITPTPTSTVSTTTSSSQGNMSSSCGDQAPTSAPQLFQVNAKGTSVTTYFVPVSGSNNKYVVSYGLTSSADSFTTSFAYSDRSGLIPYTINSLFPGTWFFKVRGQNGCMPGNWSNVMSVQVVSFVSLGSTSIELKTTENNMVGIAAGVTCTNYSVQSGDSLWAIASQKLGNGTKYQSIMQKNNLFSSLIHIGQTLKIGC